MSNKVDFKAEKTTRNTDRERHYNMLEGSIHLEDTAILNGCAPNHIVAKYVKQKLIELEREIDKSTIIVGDSTSCSQQLIEQ